MGSLIDMGIKPAQKVDVAFILIASVSWTLTGVHGAETSKEQGLIRLSDRAWAWIARDERSSNGALFVGESSALIVDPGLTPSVAAEFLAAAGNVTAQPIRYVVLTHWHPDHALGALCQRDRTYSLIAHPKTRRALAERAARMRSTIAATAGHLERSELTDCQIVLPDRMISEREVFDLGSHQIEVFHDGSAHTGGDLVVWSADEGVLVTGDLFMHDSCPSMGEGSVINWIETLDRLTKLEPGHVIPGHFAVGTIADLSRFRNYLAAMVSHIEAKLSAGADLEEIPGHVSLPAFSTFRQFPQYGATFTDNASAVLGELAARPAQRGEIGGFRILATLEVGKNPHQISFGPKGKTAFVAAAGSNQVTRVDVDSLRVEHSISVNDVPLGVVVLPDGLGLAVSQFRSDRIARVDRKSGAVTGELNTGGAPSLLMGPLPNGQYLVSVEQADLLWVIDARGFRLERSYPTGKRPFPPSATSDGRLAFVPNYDDDSVTIVDLWNEQVLETVGVGDRPSGGSVLPGDVEYAVVVRGENRIAFINTASHQVVGSLYQGIGDSPFSLVISPNGRLAFVNNTASHDVSVILLPERRVIARVPVGEIPIVMAVHPSGETLWVASEGSHELTIIEIPNRWRAATDQPVIDDHRQSVTEVAVLGMIHGRHRTSRMWGLDQVRQTINRFAPDAVLAEIPPDRWDRIWSDYTERGVIEDERVALFPEYTDVLLPLAVQTGIEIVPCAAWTREMSDLRQARIRAFQTDPVWGETKAEYDRELAEIAARHSESLDDLDDPRSIHTDGYDQRIREELAPYDKYLNEWIGPGGWSNINTGHMTLIDRAIRARRGKRLLITFGTAHKYWFLDRLRERDDVRLIDIGPFLPPAAEQAPSTTVGEVSTDMHERCEYEVRQLHQFFEDWFAGRVEPSDAHFDRFESVIARDFEMITPDGHRSQRGNLIDRVRKGHGIDKGNSIRIWTENYAGRPLGGDLYLTTYEEWQSRSSEKRGRLSTAIFRERFDAPNGVEWVHLHEVWLPKPDDSP